MLCQGSFTSGRWHDNIDINQYTEMNVMMGYLSDFYAYYSNFINLEPYKDGNFNTVLVRYSSGGSGTWAHADYEILFDTNTNRLGVKGAQDAVMNLNYLIYFR